MENIRVRVTDNDTIVVVADSKRFGKDAIMFEERTFMRCFDYIRRKTGKNHFKISGIPGFVGLFRDAEGRMMAKELWIHDFR